MYRFHEILKRAALAIAIAAIIVAVADYSAAASLADDLGVDFKASEWLGRQGAVVVALGVAVLVAAAGELVQWVQFIASKIDELADAATYED